VFRALGISDDDARGEVRLPARRAQVRRAPARRHRPRDGPPGDAPLRRREHPRRGRLPQDPEGDRPHDRRPQPGLPRPARRALCGLYRFTLDLVTSRRLVAGGRALLGRAATLTIVTLDGATRLVHGVITEQRVAAHDASHELRTLRLRLEPRMALLRHRVRSRVFHDLSPAAVVSTVLRAWGMQPEGRFTRAAPRLEHCVQRRESDLAFVERVLARHGLSWWFEHPQGGGDVDADDTRAELEGATVAGDGELGDTDLGREKLVLCDLPERYSALGGGATPRALRYIGRRADGGGYEPGDVPVFTAEDRVRPTAARVTRYDPARHEPAGARHVTDQAELRDARTTEAALGLALDAFEAEHCAAAEPGSARSPPGGRPPRRRALPGQVLPPGGGAGAALHAHRARLPRARRRLRGDGRAPHGRGGPPGQRRPPLREQLHLRPRRDAGAPATPARARGAGGGERDGGGRRRRRRAHRRGGAGAGALPLGRARRSARPALVPGAGGVVVRGRRVGGAVYAARRERGAGGLPRRGRRPAGGGGGAAQRARRGAVPGRRGDAAERDPHAVDRRGRAQRAVLRRPARPRGGVPARAAQPPRGGAPGPQRPRARERRGDGRRGHDEASDRVACG
jgi:hypothetical protein